MLKEVGNIHIKSTVRGGLIKNYWTRWENSHTSIDTFKSCSSSGKSVSGKTSFVKPPDYKYAFINNLIKEKNYSNKKLRIIKKILNISLI